MVAWNGPNEVHPWRQGLWFDDWIWLVLAPVSSHFLHLIAFVCHMGHIWTWWLLSQCSRTILYNIYHISYIYITYTALTIVTLVNDSHWVSSVAVHEAPRLGCDDPTGDQWSTHQNAGALLSWPLGHSWRWPFLHGEPFGDLLGYYMIIWYDHDIQYIWYDMISMIMIWYDMIMMLGYYIIWYYVI